MTNNVDINNADDAFAGAVGQGALDSCIVGECAVEHRQAFESRRPDFDGCLNRLNAVDCESVMFRRGSRTDGPLQKPVSPVCVDRCGRAMNALCIELSYELAYEVDGPGLYVRHG